jgi:hypothetical protein
MAALGTLEKTVMGSVEAQIVKRVGRDEEEEKRAQETGRNIARV